MGAAKSLPRLRAALDGAMSGTVGTTLIGGEAGVGKSRLLAEFRAGATSEGLRVLEGGCVDLGDGARPYDPFVAALRPWLRSLPAEDFDRIVGPARSTVLQLIPDLGSDAEAEAEVRATAPASATQSTLYLQVLGLIERIAADAVTVIALEDLHWSDRSTRDLLRFLVRNLTQGRVMLIGTYRTDELNERHPFLTLLAELGRSGQVDRFELAPFTRNEVHDQMAGILGRPPDRSLVAQLHDRGGGNAFFTEELLAVAERSEQRIGLTLRETLLARVGGLSPASRDLLRVVAVAGQSARHDVLAAVAKMQQAELAATLREAIDRQLLLAGDDEVMQFRHGLLQEAVYDELLPGAVLASDHDVGAQVGDRTIERGRVRAHVPGAANRDPAKWGADARRCSTYGGRARPSTWRSVGHPPLPGCGAGPARGPDRHGHADPAVPGPGAGHRHPGLERPPRPPRPRPPPRDLGLTRLAPGP